MGKAKYRINAITIEGFRGFTSPQTIEIGGRNAFIFGVNGQGKSSIIEAIRWGLFGSTGQEIEVRNTFYAKAECAVSIDLVSSDGSMTIRRELHPGMTRSQKNIRDAAGNILQEKDVFPQLARIGHQEGTQVIFAAQHATGRQAQVDITDFTRVLCFYMRLERVPELLQRLASLISEHQEEYRGLAQRLELAENAIRSDLKQTQDRTDEILRNPPWGEGPAPTGSETEAKITSLVGDAARTKGTSSPKNEQAREALGRLKQELDHVGAESVCTLQTKLDIASKRRDAAEAAITAFSQARDNHASLAKEIADLNNQLCAVLSGDTPQALGTRLAVLERSLTEKAAIDDLAGRARRLCSEYGWSRCPVCGTEHNGSIAEHNHLLAKRIDAGIRAVSEAPTDSAPLDDLRKRVKQISALTESLDRESKALAEASARLALAEAQLAGALPELATPVEISQAKAKDDELRRDIETLASQVADIEGNRQQWAKRVKDLGQELIYHSYLDRIQRLQTKLADGLEGARNLLRQYQELLTTTTSLHGLLELAFKNALDRAVPPLEQMLTEAYQRLTRQPSYDQVKIICPLESPRRRELRVAASRLPGQTFLPNVLNGQAAKALQLVPYFVFSKFQPEIMELDLLLIDDPSESFDTSHVIELVTELARAAEHAQLFVATHEMEKFERHLSNCFNTESRVEISVEGFTTMEGPILACR
jgi:DNA repair exonuclease SbcCD ATPase subunit